MMSKKILAVIVVALLAALLAPPLALAASVSLSLSPNTASPGDAVAASGTADPDTWVTIKGIDSTQNIVEFSGVKSDAQGAYSDTFRVPDTSGIWTIVAGYGSNVASQTLTIANNNNPGPVVIQSVSAANGTVTVTLSGTPSPAPTIGDFVVTQSINGAAATTITPSVISATGAVVTLTVPTVNQTASSQSVVISVSYQGGAPVAASEFTISAQSTGPGGGGGGTPPAAVTSTTGSATVNPAAGGSISLGSDASVSIPAGALNGTAGVNVTVQKVSSPPAAPSGFMVLGSIYEFSVGGGGSYTFNKPVTLTFTFDPATLASGETPSIYYYDQTKGQWVNLGGTVSGNTITITVDHFTKFAVLAKGVVPPPVPAQLFSDVPASYWASDVIASLANQGYISGYPDGSFQPDNQITRAEFVAVLYKVLKLPVYRPAEASFSDVSQSDWYYEPVESAVHAGIVKGYGSAFAPNDPVTREQMAVMIANAAQIKPSAAAISFSDSGQVSAWARDALAAVAQSGIMKGYPDGSFHPQGKATRAEAAAVISGAFK